MLFFNVNDDTKRAANISHFFWFSGIFVLFQNFIQVYENMVIKK